MTRDWDEREVDLVVDAYFSMLSLELAGEHYVKAEFRRGLAQQLERSAPSMEFKFRNISAVLESLGAIPIAGYKPARNTQSLLRERVTAKFDQSPELRQDMMRALTAPVTANEPITLPSPTEPPHVPQDSLTTYPVRPVQVDFLAIEAANRSLGLAGEYAILDYEKACLRQQGRSDLAADVRHVSEQDGDGLGYDILSFDPSSGAPLYLEVKTTRQSADTPFHLTRNEVQFSAEAGASFRLARVFGFGTSPGQYRLCGPLSATTWTTPVAYIAGPRELSPESHAS